ncbi:MAG: PDZ domain-containing protein [Gemmatimonadaceae bacterium]
MGKLASALVALVALGSVARALGAQHPLRHATDGMEMRFARSQPVLGYTLRVDSADLTSITVAIRIRGGSDTIRLALAAHPEYDDRFFRYVEDVRAETPRGAAAVTREDSALWRVIAPGGEAIVHYRIHLPAQNGPQHPAWTPYLTPTGGLVGGPHAFMYVLGANLAPMHVTLDIPASWDVATGLELTSDPRTFYAPSADVLIDSPVLVGRLRNWRFIVDGVPHRIAYWPRPDAVPFDTARFVGGVERIVRQAVGLFGRAPYRDYTFLFQDAAWGALEHANSVTLGAPSDELDKAPLGYFEEIAHEYFHSWNLVRIRPEGRGALVYKQGGQTRGLWVSEGFSMYYADVLLRRAGIPLADTTRITHLQGLMERYFFSAGAHAVSPERVSLAEYGSAPGALGDYVGSPHLQGELIGTVLDLAIRDATHDTRSLDDVMRTMLDRFSGERGFVTSDVEHVVADVCGCDMHPFFEAHVRGAFPLDFDRYLAMVGLRARVTWSPMLGDDQLPARDLRLRGWEEAGVFRLQLTNPASVWGKAGLHTGDRLTSVNGGPIGTWPALRALLGKLKIGDTVRVEVARATGAYRTTVVIAGYERPNVRIEERPGATTAQRERRTSWLAAAR